MRFAKHKGMQNMEKRKRAGMTTKPKRRARNPVATREAILAAARTILAKDGQEALSLSKVAVLAKVNRGTA